MSQGLLDYSHVSQPLSKFTCSNIKAPLSHYELILEANIKTSVCREFSWQQTLGLRLIHLEKHY